MTLVALATALVLTLKHNGIQYSASVQFCPGSYSSKVVDLFITRLVLNHLNNSSRRDSTGKLSIDQVPNHFLGFFFTLNFFTKFILLRIDVTTVQLGVHELFTRGGVEDTRLAAKAKTKNAKKIRDQGQGRGQTLSRG